jgi:hypothetical protein
MSDTKVTENKEPIIDELLQRIKDAGSNVGASTHVILFIIFSIFFFINLV